MQLWQIKEDKDDDPKEEEEEEGVILILVELRVEWHDHGTPLVAEGEAL